MLFDTLVLVSPLLGAGWLWRYPPVTRVRTLRRVAMWAVVLPLAAYGFAAWLAPQLRSAPLVSEAMVAGWWLIALGCGASLVLDIGRTALDRVSEPYRAMGRLAGLAGFTSFFMAMLFVSLSIHRMKLAPLPLEGAIARGVRLEALDFHAPDGASLSGTLWLHPSPRPGLVLCHGLGANRNDVAGIARLLHDEGYQVLSFDFRGHGESSGHTVTYGLREKSDVGAAVTELLSHPLVSGEQVGIQAYSMGASSALLHASTDTRVAGVVAEAGYADLVDVARSRFDFLPSPLDAGMAQMVSIASWIQLGVWASDVSVERTLAQRSHPFALLLLHGTADPIVPFDHGERLHRSVPTSRFLRCDGAGHAGCLTADPRGSWAEITSFWERELGPIGED